MNEYLMYLAIGFGGLLVALLIPGVNVLAQMLLKGLASALLVVLQHKGVFLVWFVKTVLADHTKVFQHATQTEDTIDPTQKIRREAEGREDA